MTREEMTRQAIGEAWDFWLNQHPISIGGLIKESIQEAVKAWLDSHEDEILDRFGKEKP